MNRIMLAFILTFTFIFLTGCDNNSSPVYAENRTKPCRINEHAGGFDGDELYSYILHHYNERGWLSMIERHKGSRVGERVIYEYDDRGNLTNRKYQAAPLSIEDTSDETRYAYDSEGHLLEFHDYGLGDSIDSCEFVYEDGLITKICIRTGADGFVTKLEHDHFYELSSTGYLKTSFEPSLFGLDLRRLYIRDLSERLEVEYWDTNDLKFYNKEFYHTYSKNNRLVEISEYFLSRDRNSRNLNGLELITYDAGSFIDYKQFNTRPRREGEDDELLWHSEYTYDELGRVVKQVRTRDTSVKYFSYEYDCENEPAKEQPKCHPLIDYTTNFDYKCFHNIFPHTNCVCQTPLAKHIE